MKVIVTENKIQGGAKANEIIIVDIYQREPKHLKFLKKESRTVLKS